MYKLENFDELVAALRAAIDFAYTVERQNDGESIPYDGPELQHFMIVASSFGVAQALSAENLAYKAHEADALSMILTKAIELGMQRAFRMVEQRPYMLRLYELEKCSPGMLQALLETAREREAAASG